MPLWGHQRALCPRPVSLPGGLLWGQWVPGLWLARLCGSEGTPTHAPLCDVYFQYRSINHRMDARSVWLYRLYYSNACQW